MDRTTSTLSPATSSIALTLLLAALPPLAQAASQNRIEGTWINTVKVVSCASPQTVLATFQSMTTYQRDGTLIEGGGPATPPPGASRSAGHGIWERNGRHSISAQFTVHVLDSLGRLVRINEVTTKPTLTQGDDPATTVLEPYFLSGWGTVKVTNVDPSTGAVMSVAEGCNHATSRPMLLD
jgi:hypothetical protein